MSKTITTATTTATDAVLDSITFAEDGSNRAEVAAFLVGANIHVTLAAGEDATAVLVWTAELAPPYKIGNWEIVPVERACHGAIIPGRTVARTATGYVIDPGAPWARAFDA